MDTSLYIQPSARPYCVSFFILFLLLSGLMYVVGQYAPSFNPYLFILAFFALYLIISGAAFLYFKQFYMHIEEDVVTVKQGIITSKVSVIPFNKITEVSTQFTIVDRILGLGTVTLELMGAEQDDIVFAGVPADRIAAFVAVFRRSRESKTHPSDKPDEQKPILRQEKDMW